MPKPKKQAETVPPAAATPDDDISRMNDEELIEATRRAIALNRLLIEQGKPIDPADVDRAESNLEKFINDVEAEKIAHEKARISEEKMLLSADAYLAAIDETTKPRPTFISPKGTIRKRGN